MKTYKRTLKSSLCVVWEPRYLLCQFLTVAILKFKMAAIILDEQCVPQFDINLTKEKRTNAIFTLSSHFNTKMLTVIKYLFLMKSY